MGSLLRSRKQYVSQMVLMLYVASFMCGSLAEATPFEKINNKSPLISAQQQQQPQQVPRNIALKQQELEDVAMGRYQYEPSEEELLLSNLLENGRHLNMMDNRFYYNGQPVSALSEYDDDNEDIDNDFYNGNSMPNEEKRSSSKSPLFHVFRRGCLRRGGNCDHRPNDCCSNACRCNLWGTNCRCQRMGIFQKWG